MKDALARDAVIINGVAVGSEGNTLGVENFAKSKARYGRFFLVRVGKKNYHLFEVE